MYISTFQVLDFCVFSSSCLHTTHFQLQEPSNQSSTNPYNPAQEIQVMASSQSTTPTSSTRSSDSTRPSSASSASSTTKITQRCTSLYCPVNHPHDRGVYLASCRVPLSPESRRVFAPSAPPPDVLAAYERCVSHRGTKTDEELWVTFHELHVEPLIDGAFAAKDAYYGKGLGLYQGTLQLSNIRRPRYCAKLAKECKIRKEKELKRTRG